MYQLISVVAVVSGCFFSYKTEVAVVVSNVELVYLFCYNMTLPEEALRKLAKDELVNLSLQYQSEFNSTLAIIDKDMGELRKDLKKLEAYLTISRSVNTKLRDRMISLERQCWSNSQYFRRECLEITGLPDSLNNENLEEKTQMIFEELEVIVDSSKVEDCHWLPGNRNNRFIIKLSKRKDANKMRRVKKVEGNELIFYRNYRSSVYK